MKRLMTGVGMLTSLVMLLGGCASWISSSAHDRPYFVTDRAESKEFQSLARKQEGIVAKCVETSSCDHAYFMREIGRAHV